MSTYDEQLNELAAFGKAEAARQGTADWLRVRTGKITASRFQDVIAKGARGDYLAGRETYLWEIVIERLTDQAADHYTSTAMQWGIDNENAARMAYEARTGELVEQVGFIGHPHFKYLGGSPDGLVGAHGGFEAKCPFNSAVHLQTILNGMPGEHMAQIQGLMMITGRKWWDFVSFDPRLPEPFNIYMQTIARSDEYIAALEIELAGFNAAVQETLDRLHGKGFLAKVAE